MTPLEAALPHLLTALRERGACVLVAPPGAGKSTGVPLALLRSGALGAGRCVMLQPRRIAARAVARRMAQVLGEPVGGAVGYRVRFEDRTSARTRIEVVTEGLLTRRLQSDPFLEGVSLVVLDEIHERSLHADLALAMLAEVRRDARPDLAIIVMSATLDPAPFAAFLDDCPVVRVDARPHPVEVVYDRTSSVDSPVDRCPAAR
jgi:ATP-dependent helicase HrpB